MGEFTDILFKFGIDTELTIKRNLASTGTNASGETSNSVKTKMPTDSKVQVVGKEFINVVETGRKPGKMPPISPLIKWLETGKISFEGKAESMAWAIAKTIAKKGSKLFRDGGRTDIITPAISETRITALTKRISNHALDVTVETIKDGIHANANA